MAKRKQIESIGGWDWDTLVASWRYFEYRHSISSATFPCDIIERLWVEEHNFLASEENRKAYNRCHGHFARSSQDNRHIHHITTGMSAREAAHQSI